MALRRRAGVVSEPVEIVTITCSCGRRLYPEPGDTVRISLIQGPSGGGWRCVSHEYDHLCEMTPLDPGCKCAVRAYLATASDEDLAARDARTGYDHSNLETTP